MTHQVYQLDRSQYAHLVSLLLPELYSTIIMTRYLQWPHKSPTAHFYTTFPLIDEATNKPIATLPRTFCITHLDRPGVRGGQLLILSSLELPRASSYTTEEKAHATIQLLGMLAHLHTLDPPTDTTTTDVLFVGHLHTTTAHLLLDHSILTNKVLNGGPYNKYVIRYKRTGTLPALPAGMRYSTITPADYALVKQNNELIRDLRVFDNCPTAAIRVTSAEGQVGEAETQQGELIAWAILTGYGSVRTLHVQPAYRRLGLARKVVLKLLEDDWPAAFVSDLAESAEAQEEVVVHANADPSNIGSIKTFAGIGPSQHTQGLFWEPVELANAEYALGAFK